MSPETMENPSKLKVGSEAAISQNREELEGVLEAEVFSSENLNTVPRYNRVPIALVSIQHGNIREVMVGLAKLSEADRSEIVQGLTKAGQGNTIIENIVKLPETVDCVEVARAVVRAGSEDIVSGNLDCFPLTDRIRIINMLKEEAEGQKEEVA